MHGFILKTCILLPDIFDLILNCVSCVLWFFVRSLSCFAISSIIAKKFPLLSILYNCMIRMIASNNKVLTVYCHTAINSLSLSKLQSQKLPFLARFLSVVTDVSTVSPGVCFLQLNL